MVTPYPGRIVENFGLEGIFVLTSLFPGQASLHCLCLRWNISSDGFSLFLMAGELYVQDWRLTDCLNVMGELGYSQKWGPHSIPGGHGSSSEASGSAGRSQSFGTVGPWQLLFSPGVKNAGCSPLRVLQIMRLAPGVAENRMQVWLAEWGKNEHLGPYTQIGQEAE